MIRSEVVQAYYAIGLSQLQFAMEDADIVSARLMPPGDHLAVLLVRVKLGGNLGAAKPPQVLSRLGMREKALSIGRLQLKKPSHVCLYWSSVKRAGRI